MPEPRPGRRLWLAVLVPLLAGCTALGDPGGALPTAVATPTPAPSAPTIQSQPPSGSVAAVPTSTPETTPTEDPGLEAELELEVTGCPGGVVVDWSSTTHPNFHHYIGLRSIEPDVNPAYPPIAPAVDWGDSYVTDRYITSAVDATLIPSETTLYYRVMAYDADNRVLAASQVRSTNLTQVAELGPLTVTAENGGAATTLEWGRFGGVAPCFSAYQVLIGPAGSVPSSTLTLVADQAETELRTTALQPGQSYAIRVDAIRSTTLGSFVVGRSEVATYTPP